MFHDSEITQTATFFTPWKQHVHNTLQRPFVTLSWAQSLDGFLTAKEGSPTAISCKESLCPVHYLRGHSDGILVGINTILSDNPSLTCRGFDSHMKQPRPVILDSQLRTPMSCQVLNRHPIIVTRRDCHSKSMELLQMAGATILPIEMDKESKYLSIPLLLRILKELFGMQTLMVEGGPRVLQSFLSSQMVDAILLTMSPQLFASGKHLSLGSSMESVPFTKSSHLHWERFGSDIIMLALDPFP